MLPDVSRPRPEGGGGGVTTCQACIFASQRVSHQSGTLSSCCYWMGYFLCMQVYPGQVAYTFHSMYALHHAWHLCGPGSSLLGRLLYRSIRADS